MTVRAATSLISNAAKRVQTRSITIGTDMRSSAISLQKPRPWHMSDSEGSNLEADNAVSLTELFADKTVAFFAVPAPYTGTCTHAHYPPYKKLADEIKNAGVDEIVCFAVSDPYCMNAWEKSLENDPSKIRFLTDPDISFTKAFGMDVDYSESSLGVRSKRFSMLVVDGVVKTFRLVDAAENDADQILEDIKEWNENTN